MRKYKAEVVLIQNGAEKVVASRCFDKVVQAHLYASSRASYWKRAGEVVMRVRERT